MSRETFKEGWSIVEPHVLKVYSLLNQIKDDNF